MGIVVIEPRLIATHQGQVFEKGEGKNEVKKPWVWKEDWSHTERLVGG